MKRLGALFGLVLLCGCVTLNAFQGANGLYEINATGAHWVTIGKAQDVARQTCKGGQVVEWNERYTGVPLITDSWAYTFRCR